MEIRGLLDRLNIGVVVTVDEDERLERDGIDHDPWERYRRAGIKWIDRRAEAVDVTDAEPPNTPLQPTAEKRGGSAAIRWTDRSLGLLGQDSEIPMRKTSR